MKYIISASQGGLSNRINCLISSMKIGNETNRKLLLYWPKSKWCNCHFKDLFENKIEEVSKEDLRKRMLSRNYELYQSSLKNFKNKKRSVLIDNAKLIGFLERDLFPVFNKIPKEIKEELSKYQIKIKIKKKILKKVEDFSKRFDETVIGIHIRKRESKNLRRGLGKVSNEDLFVEKMKKELEKNSKTNFFLAAEDEETEKKFKGIFKSKIITYPKKTKERGEEGAIKEAFIELLLLSKTKKIYGTFESTFSELASLFGRNELEIIIDKEEFKKFTERVKKEERNLFNKIKKFIYELIYPKEKRFFRIIVK